MGGIERKGFTSCVHGFFKRSGMPLNILFNKCPYASLILIIITNKMIMTIKSICGNTTNMFTPVYNFCFKENKVYVQHKLKEQGPLLWDLIDKQGAYFYVAG